MWFWRLERLGADTVALSQAVAVLEHATLHEASELARLDPEAAVTAADELLAANILTA